MKKAIVVGKTLLDDRSGGALGTLADILAIRAIYGKNIKVVIPSEARERLENEFDIEVIPVDSRSFIQSLVGAVTLTSIDRFQTFIDKNMDTLFGDANIVFFTGAVLGRHAGRITEQFGIPSVCLLYTSPSPRDATLSRMPSSA